MSNNSDELKKTTGKIIYVEMRPGSCIYKPVVVAEPSNTTNNIK